MKHISFVLSLQISTLASLRHQEYTFPGFIFQPPRRAYFSICGVQSENMDLACIQNELLEQI